LHSFRIYSHFDLRRRQCIPEVVQAERIFSLFPGDAVWALPAALHATNNNQNHGGRWLSRQSS
jgi:hypothetical protein